MDGVCQGKVIVIECYSINMDELEKEHIEAVQKISISVKDFNEKGIHVRIFHGSSNSTRAQVFDPTKMVDVSKMNRVITINFKEKYALVEPNVPMDALVDATMKHGLIPPVVMEFPGITVGGGIQGGSGESSSFKYGLFHETCLEYEMVIGNGEVVIVSPNLHPDLFYGTACSYGSLGILTAIKISLIPAKEYVKLTYKRTIGAKDTIDETLQQAKVLENDFVDGIIFSDKLGTVMTGTFNDKVKMPIVSFSRAQDDWFYIHAQKITKKFEVYEELIPLKDYIFRYDRGGFWVGKHSLSRFYIPFNRLSRYILNPAMSTRRLYSFLHATNISQEYIVQDISVPGRSALQFIRYIQQKIQIYPLWLCPLRPDTNVRLSPNYIKTDMVLNVGIWGTSSGDYAQFKSSNREIEKITEELGGRKVLYAHAYYPLEEFWKIYDKEWYEGLRQKYLAVRVFPDIYTKVFVRTEYKTTVIKGMLQVTKNHIFKSLLR